MVSQYTNRHINGKWDRKPHIVFTVAEREYIGTKGRSGYDEIIKNAIKDGRVLDYNAKKRDDLSVIAESAGPGNITKSSLEHNLSRFRKEVKSFREKNKISYQKKRVIPEDDAVYMDAVNRGDMATAQRMVKEVANDKFAESKLRDQSGDLKSYFHGTSRAGFTEFKTQGTAKRKAFFFTNEKNVANTSIIPGKKVQIRSAS